MPDLLGYFLRSSVVMMVGIVLYLCFLGWVVKLPTMTEKEVRRTALAGACLFYAAAVVWASTGLVWVVVG